jgi:SAM-dependent methyltransferase
VFRFKEFFWSGNRTQQVRLFMNIATPLLDAGIPGTDDYEQLVQTSLFRDMETFSNDFLRKNMYLQDHYKWVKDPLHQWSRQWEYPYVYQSIKEYMDTRHDPYSRVKVLDAGSGITFFPYYMEQTIQGLDITCCDSDGSLISLYDRVTRSASAEPKVKFIETDMHALPFGDESVDVIYCISVLEHTRSYSRILDEFHRILVPGGWLVLTFDVGLDGVSEIAPEPARHLLGEVARRFSSRRDSPEIEINAEGILTSNHIIQRYNHLSPWRFPKLALIKAALRAKRIPSSLGKNLTVYCNTFIKQSAQG